jgi:hypothetical protein
MSGGSSQCPYDTGYSSAKRPVRDRDDAAFQEVVRDSGHDFAPPSPEKCIFDQPAGASKRDLATGVTRGEHWTEGR